MYTDKPCYNAILGKIYYYFILCKFQIMHVSNAYLYGGKIYILNSFAQETYVLKTLKTKDFRKHCFEKKMMVNSIFFCCNVLYPFKKN